MTTSIAGLRKKQPHVVCIGSHPGIIQSMLDYDYLLGRKKPSILAIVARGRKQERYFFGTDEVILPVVAGLDALTAADRQKITAVLNVQSARRVLATTQAALQTLPNLQITTIFAEQTPEQHSLELIRNASEKASLVVGPASVGLLLPGVLKLGAIGGTQHQQITAAGIMRGGDVAVVSTSGGMVNELIHIVTGGGHGVSFALALGGDRYPITTPAEAMLLAEADPTTKRIVYFGELGGDDEYEIARLIETKKLTKQIIAYVAGTVAELFETPPQFGHAKALAQNADESAGAKKQALRDVGVDVVDSIAQIHSHLGPPRHSTANKAARAKIGVRRKRLISSRISGDKNGETQLLGQDLLTTIEKNTYASLLLSLLLGQRVTEKKLINFTDYVLRLLVDHGPQVSGAMNTIVASRAGKDLVSSLTAGLLTIGHRFGGAINQAAANWLQNAQTNTDPRAFVEGFKAFDGIIPGIGHKKYRIDMPDPRVARLKAFTGGRPGRYLTFALGVEAVTTAKKGNLILNVDGAIAAMLLDLLESELRYSPEELQELVDAEFFNALFVLSRSTGLVAHYIDQRRHDEGLFRLADDDVIYVASEE